MSPSCSVIQSWRLRQHVPLKILYPPASLHVANTQSIKAPNTFFTSVSCITQTPLLSPSEQTSFWRVVTLLVYIYGKLRFITWLTKARLLSLFSAESFYTSFEIIFNICTCVCNSVYQGDAPFQRVLQNLRADLSYLMSWQSLPLRFHHFNNIWWSVQIIKFLLSRFRSQDQTLSRTRAVFSLNVTDKCFTPIPSSR